MKPLTDSVSAQQRDAFMESLERHVMAVLADLKMDKATIELAVAEIATAIIKDHPGQSIYIPTDYRHRSMEYAISVYNAIQGRNHAQVAKQFGCSERTVYRIYNRIRPLIVAKSQLDIFNHRGEYGRY